jgi:hypothetical protein
MMPGALCAICNYRFAGSNPTAFNFPMIPTLFVGLVSCRGLAYLLQTVGNRLNAPEILLKETFMNFACSPAQVVGKLVIQIQSLVTKPGFQLKTPERSPLFQIAAHLEFPSMAPCSANQTVKITDKTFADIRREALKPRNLNGRRKNSVKRTAFSPDNQPLPIA